MFSFCSGVFASEEATASAGEVDVGLSKIHPASPFYFLKAIREHLELKFAQTDRVKRLRQLEFAQRRLREVTALIPIDQDLIQPTLERYIVYLSSLTDKHRTNDEYNIIMKNNLAIHLKVLEQIYDQVVNPRAKMSIRSAMNRIIQRADVADHSKRLICDFFFKEASSSALNQTERMVLLERAKKCLAISQ